MHIHSHTLLHFNPSTSMYWEVGGEMVETYVGTRTWRTEAKDPTRESRERDSLRHQADFGKILEIVYTIC